MAAQHLRDGKGEGRGAVDQAQRLLCHEGETEGEQQGEDGISAIERPEQEAFDEDPQQRHRHRRHHEGAAEAQILGQRDGEVGADGEEAAMRQIDDAAEAEDQRETQRDQEVVHAVEQAVQNLLHQ